VKRLKRIFSGFLLGIVVGAVIGALGGLLDQGSMMILMPSGPPFWSIIGAFVGSIVGALYGSFSGSSSKNVLSLKSKGVIRNGSDPN
jgi:hypothetical protein